MQDTLDLASRDYFEKWDHLVASVRAKDFFAELKPMAVGWKVADKAEYDKLYAELHDECDRIVETWMNGRWIAKLHLKDKTLSGGVSLIKLMQRRPDSNDAIGLDHVDFYSPSVTDAEEILKEETDLKWSWESNYVIDSYDWISLWFDGTEAKLKADTVLDIVQAELGELSQRIKND